MLTLLTEAAMTEEEVADLALGTAGVGAIFGAMLGSILICALIWYVIQVIAYWKIFNKMGEAGWKSIIPFYNGYIVYKNTWNTKMFWITIGLACLVGVFNGLMEGGNVVFALIALVAAVVLLVIEIKSTIYLGKAFDKGTGFIVGLVLLSPIFMLILGFGSAEFIGNQSEQ
ncbi:MAG: DUF5684 domain-containing protein [Lachnospiraceae bacterium]|nr:DUF5684 domain-containing protein [Lachnospiraceae bacterium]